MIIILHYFNSQMGGLFENVKKFSMNYWISHFIESACIIAVNIFIIITGYFSYKKEEVRISKVIKLLFLMFFYGIIISSAIISTGLVKFNIKDFVMSVTSRWFVIIYIILYLMIPYINKIINSLSQKEFRTLMLINIFFFYLWPTIFTGTTLKDGGYGIINFINLYMIGCYIRLFKDDNKISKFLLLLIYILCTCLTCAFSVFSSRAWEYSSIMNLANSIVLFLFFKELNIKGNKIINQLSTYTFAIYLIHENSFISTILYRKLFHSDKYWNNNLMIVNLIISVIGIYSICIAIEFLRRVLFRKIFDDNIDKIQWTISCKRENT